jgi:hypothetical protein
MQTNAHRRLIHDRYAAAHGAAPCADYPAYLTIGTPDDPVATLGLRHAGAAPLFLERYLDRPIEQVLTEAAQRPVPRARIAELGDHASRRSAATIGLWREAAAALAGQADYAVAVLTRPLRAIAPARIEALGGEGARWGRYYAADPVICAGEVAEWHRRLDRAVRA